MSKTTNMTDNEIINTLENLIKLTEKDLAEEFIPYTDNDTVDCKVITIKEVIGIINRLKSANEKNERIIELADKTIKVQSAEIERLKFRKCLYSGLYSEYDIKLIRDCTQGKCFHRESEEAVRLEAIKEFAERLKSVSHPYADTQMVFELQIDNLVKEMVGDDNG